MNVTRHYGASATPTSQQRETLKRLREERQLPGYGTVLSVNTMLDILHAIERGEGTGFEADKLIQWCQRFPLATEAAKVQPWQDWAPETVEAIAESVLMLGRTEARTAIEYGTTPQTVTAIVADYRLRIRRGAPS